MPGGPWVLELEVGEDKAVRVGFLQGLVLKVDMGRCGLFPKIVSNHSSMYIHTGEGGQRETEQGKAPTTPAMEGIRNYPYGYLREKAPI